MPIRKKGGTNRASADKTEAMELGCECYDCPYIGEPIVYSEGSIDAEMALIGPAPHNEEVRTSKQFAGPSGVLLDNALESVGLNREDMFITNTILCKPSRGTSPSDHAILCCSPRLQAELKGKQKIMTLGDVPRKALVTSSRDHKISEVRGSWFDNEDIGACLVTNHPAMCLHSNPESFRDILNDFKKLILGPNRVPEVEFETVDSAERLLKIVSMIPDDASLIFDIETSNLDNEQSTPGERWNSYILSLAFCWEPGQAYVITTDLWAQVHCHKIMLPVFTRSKGLVGHNVKFDILNVQESYQRTLGTRPEMIIEDDTLLMHYVLDERRGTHGLKILSGLFEEPDYDGVLKKYLRNKNDSYSKIPRPILYRYNAKDVDFTLRLQHIFRKELLEKKLFEWPYQNVLIRALQTLTDAEAVGMYLYRDTLEESRLTLQGNVDDLRIQLRDLGTEPELNPNSPQQVKKIIYGKLGFTTPRGRSIKPGSTNKEALQKLAGKHPFIDTLSNYRRFNKLLTTYANKIANFCDHDDFTHFEYNLAGSVTGRIAAGLLLTIPRAYTPEGKLIRNCFGAPPLCEDLHPWQQDVVDKFIDMRISGENSEGVLQTENCEVVLVDADYSQAELRYLGWAAADEFLHDVYLNNRDLHSEVTEKLFNITGDHPLWKEKRMASKMLNFSFAYSAESSENSFAEDTGVPVHMARTIIHDYGQVLSGVSAWKKGITAQVRSIGVIRTATGRRRRFPLITQRNEHEVMNQAVNFPIQSISNDATLISFSRLNEEFKQKQWPVWPVLFMHDGIYLIMLNDAQLVKEVSTRVQIVMEDTALEMQELGLFPEYRNLPTMPFKADLGIRQRWN